MIKFNQTKHISIPLPSGRKLITTIKKGVITVQSDSYDNNFNNDKK